MTTERAAQWRQSIRDLPDDGAGVVRVYLLSGAELVGTPVDDQTIDGLLRLHRCEYVGNEWKARGNWHVIEWSAIAAITTGSRS